MIRLTDNHIDVLETLRYCRYESGYRQEWVTPLDLGASNGSHHSGTLATLAKHGLVRFKQRYMPDPPEGENGHKTWAGRGSKCYQITPAGVAALTKEPTE